MTLRKPISQSLLDWPRPINNGLIGCWPLGGGNFLERDMSRSRLDGTLTNFPSNPYVGGVLGGRALLFDGTDDYVDLSNSSVLSPIAMSFSCWVNLSSLAPTYSGIYSRVVSNLVQLLVKSNGKLYVSVKATTTRIYDGTGANTLVVNQWTHLGFSYSAAAGLAGYFNGRVDATVSANGNIVANTAVASLGTDLGTAGRYMVGAMENVRFYDRALTETEFALLYNEPWVGFQRKRRAVYELKGPSGITFVSGLATEADSALPATRRKTYIAGLATEADTALHATALRKYQSALATEADSALAASERRTYSSGLATEADSALQASRARQYAAGLATEADSALAATKRKAYTAGLATELDEALAAIIAGATPAGLANETDAALPVTWLRRYAIGLATETDTALPAASASSYTVGVATEADSALPVTGLAKVRIGGLALESDIALPATVIGPTFAALKSMTVDILTPTSCVTVSGP